MTKIFTALLTALLAAVSPLVYANGITLNVRDGQVRDVLASVAALSGKSMPTVPYRARLRLTLKTYLSTPHCV